ncbi:MAG: hypothetical protein QXY62_03280 [Candidatus Altiarchaeota archaeon]
MKIRKRKFLGVLAIFLIFSIIIVYTQQSSGQQQQKSWELSKSKWYNFISMLTGEIARELVALTWLTYTVYEATNEFSRIDQYILINPNPLDPQVLRVMNFFIILAQIFYILAITATGFYLLFISGSVRGRAKAKYTLGRLIIGMLLVSISPYILSYLFNFSYLFSKAILDQKKDINIVTDEFNSMTWSLYAAHVGIKYGPGFLNRLSGNIIAYLYQTEYTLPLPRIFEKKIIGKGKLSKFSPKSEDFITSISKSAFGIKNITGDIAYYPYFAIIILFVLIFGFLAFRYLILMLWTILFPLSIFFTTFSLTRNIGRTMIEQTIQWTFLQIFYALTLVAIAIGLGILPDSYKGYDYTLFFFIGHIGFYSIAIVLILFFGPWFISSMIQRIFPP